MVEQSITDGLLLKVPIVIGGERYTVLIDSRASCKYMTPTAVDQALPLTTPDLLHLELAEGIKARATQKVMGV